MSCLLLLACCRLAALSDGHISGKGDIVCPYHGWEFNGEGQCTHNPQACSFSFASVFESCRMNFRLLAIVA